MGTKSAIKLLFVIRRNKALKNGQVPIYLRITCDKKYVEFSLGKSINQSLWSVSRNCAIGSSSQAREVNEYIDYVRIAINEIVRQLRLEDKEISALSIKDIWFGKNTENKSLLSIYKEHNDNARMLAGKDYTEGTCKIFESCYRHLQHYIKFKYSVNDIPLSKVDHKFISDMEFFLKTEKKCGHNTSMNHLKKLKKIIRIALVNGYIKADPFINYKMQQRKIDRGFLTEDELNAIMSKPLPIERISTVRDIFIVGCFTGLAYSDLKLLSPANLIKDENGQLWIHTKRMKTDTQSHIPLLPPVQRIIEKYKNSPYCEIKNVLLPVYSNQKMNAYLKEIAAICGIKKELTTHLARHTFATTVTLNNDIPIESVSKMLGHNSLATTRIYARLLDKKIASDMSKLYSKYENIENCPA